MAWVLHSGVAYAKRSSAEDRSRGPAMQISSRTLRLAVAAAFAAQSAVASGALVSSGGGDFDVVPLYRALALGTVDFGGGDATNGIDYVSNVAPLPRAPRNDASAT